MENSDLFRTSIEFQERLDDHWTLPQIDYVRFRCEYKIVFSIWLISIQILGISDSKQGKYSTLFCSVRKVLPFFDFIKSYQMRALDKHVQWEDLLSSILLAYHIVRRKLPFHYFIIIFSNADNDSEYSDMVHPLVIKCESSSVCREDAACFWLFSVRNAQASIYDAIG